MKVMKLGGLLLPQQTPDNMKHLPWVDYSTLTAVNMCPRWGIIHNVHGKRWDVMGRRMPLEAGKAMHDLFAAVRMFELMDTYHAKSQAIPMYINFHGQSLFGIERWDEAMNLFFEQDDYSTRMMRFGLNILETTGFHDDPSDRKRTQTNLEGAGIAYMDQYPKKRYIPVVDEASGFVGVEMHFDLLLDESLGFDVPVRFVGKTDGVCHDMLASAREEVAENKTGSRIDTVWIDGFTINHQPTGYCVAASVLLGKPIWTTTMWGTQIPVPKSSMFTNGQARMPVTRDVDNLTEWYKWIKHTWDIIQTWYDTPTDAPMYTHSCSRYFSSCPLIPLCAVGPAERKQVFDNEMITDRWNPLEAE
jgi:hypothetical protein